MNWLLGFLANIPHAANLTIKLREATAKIEVLEAAVAERDKQIEILRRDLDQCRKAQEHKPSPRRPRGPHSWMAS